VSRVSFSQGSYRDLDRPLVEIDPNAPRLVRWAQRVFAAYLWTMILYAVIANVLIVLSFVIVQFLNGG
jgi:hypothetical protein